MAKVHFLNVKNGDCSILQRDGTERVTMIDICCGNHEEDVALEEGFTVQAQLNEDVSIRGNFNMKNHPTNPIDYCHSIGIRSLHRFILTHPDMDHMDGLKNLYEKVPFRNFWDCGIRREPPTFNSGPYLKSNWDFYQKILRNSVEGLTLVSPRSNDKGQFWNQDDSGKDGGDYLSIVAPHDSLVSQANSSGDINDGSYVIVYHSAFGKIVFAGDSDDNTWEHILEHHSNKVQNAAVLIAPHHGRDSNRNWDFLDVINPKLTLLGNAKSEHINYAKYKEKSEFSITNNQAGNVVLDISKERIKVLVENESYARCFTNPTYENNMWYIGDVPPVIN